MPDDVPVPSGVVADPRLLRAYGWLDRQSERFNAILVREVRRALNGRLFLSMYFLLLFVCILCSLIVWLSSGNEQNVGWGLFVTLFLSFSGVAFLGLPLIASSMVQAEIRDKTFEILSITTLTAARILWGEILASLGLFILFASATAPFMAFSYLLGGVDLRTIGTGIAFILLTSMLLTLVAVVASVQQTSEIMSRIAVGLLACVAWGFALGLVNDFTSPLFFLWDEPEIGWILLTILTIYVTLAAVAFTAAMARLTFAAANRSGPLRLAVAAHLLLTGMLCWIHPDVWLWTGWCIYAMIVAFALLGTAVIGEDETLNRRQLRPGRLRSALPMTWALFLPGPTRGMAFVLVLALAVAAMAAAGIGVALAMTSRYSEYLRRFWQVPWLLLSYVVVYFAATDGVCRLYPARWRKPMVRRSTMFGLFLVTLLVPLIAAIALGPRHRGAMPLKELNPILYLGWLFNRYDSDTADAESWTFGLLLIAALSLLALGPSLLRGLRAGIPPPPLTRRNDQLTNGQ